MALDFPLIICIQSHKFLPFEWFSSRSECVVFKSIKKKLIMFSSLVLLQFIKLGELLA